MSECGYDGPELEINRHICPECYEKHLSYIGVGLSMALKDIDQMKKLFRDMQMVLEKLVDEFLEEDEVTEEEAPREH